MAFPQHSSLKRLLSATIQSGDSGDDEFLQKVENLKVVHNNMAAKGYEFNVCLNLGGTVAELPVLVLLKTVFIQSGPLC